MIEIDGSFGEGGGQVLRTSLTLSALTGQPVRIFRIRANRRNPGLAPQHLTGLLALAAVGGAEVRGAARGSDEITFAPTRPVEAGRYRVDVTEQAQGGSAGSIALIFQTLLLPLLAARGDSQLILRGGTHVANSPSFHYLAEVFLPAVARMGIHAAVKLDTWGFYPVGGGQMTAEIQGQRGTAEPLVTRSVRLVERGEPRGVTGLAVATNLPSHIPQRISARAAKLLSDAGARASIQPRRERAAGPGAGLFLTAEYAGSRAGFTSLGEKGKPSEQVADEACLDLLAHRSHPEAAVDMHLADQLMLPAALAPGVSQFTTCRVTPHLTTNAHIVQRFLPATITVEGEEGGPGRVTVEGVGFCGGQ